MSLGQHLFAHILKSIWDFAKGEGERRRVSRMTPEQLQMWRIEKCAKIHIEAVKLARFINDRELRTRGIERGDQVRCYEVLLRSDLGVTMSQYLLEGMVVMGLDLRRMRGLNQ